jgi:hypothetical protein
MFSFIKRLLFSEPERERFRLVTQGNFDGLMCAVLLQEVGMIDDIMFAQSEDLRDNAAHATYRDITANLPFVRRVHLAFDTFSSERLRRGGKIPFNHINSPNSPSSARLIYRYFGDSLAFPKISREMMEIVDKGGTGQFTREEILKPSGWTLLYFLLDRRTGLEGFKEFQISHAVLLKSLITYCRKHSIEQILALPEIKERKDLYCEHENEFREQIKRCSTVHDSLVVMDFRDEDKTFAGNRFMIYALYPECNISMQVSKTKNTGRVEISIGKSIINRTSSVQVDKLTLKYGGGGHVSVGTCEVTNKDAKRALKDLIKKITGVYV